MIFKDVKQGQTVYLFDRNTVDMKECKVTQVGLSHIDTFNKQFEMVIDITIDTGNGQQTYTFKDSNEVGYAGQLMITPNRDNVLREIQSLKSQSEETLNKIDQYKQTVEKCNTLLATFDPIYKDKKETDEKFSRLESSINELKELISHLKE